jgi:hypothetical protein
MAACQWNQFAEQIESCGNPAKMKLFLSRLIQCLGGAQEIE